MLFDASKIVFENSNLSCFSCVTYNLTVLIGWFFIFFNIKVFYVSPPPPQEIDIYSFKKNLINIAQLYTTVRRLICLLKVMDHLNQFQAVYLTYWKAFYLYFRNISFIRSPRNTSIWRKLREAKMETFSPYRRWIQQTQTSNLVVSNEGMERDLCPLASSSSRIVLKP